MPDLPLNSYDIVFMLTAIVAVFLYLREYRRRKTHSDNGLQTVQEKGWETLNQSIKKSQAILGQAELEGIKVVAEGKLANRELEQNFEKQFSQILSNSQQTLTAVQAQFIQFMQGLQRKSVEFEETSRRAGEQRIGQLFEQLETQLSDFLIRTEQQSTSSIELELKAVRQLIETYKNEQLRLIDENVVAMMEQTLSLVLAKKLSLQDQLDLVYEALERAKAEKFII